MVKSLCPSYRHWFCLNFPSLGRIVKFQSNVSTFDTVIEGIHSTDISSMCWMFPVAMMWTLVFWVILRGYSIMITVTFYWSPQCYDWIYSALCRGGCRLDFESGPCHCVGTLDQMPPGSLAVIDFAVMALPSEKNGTVINWQCHKPLEHFFVSRIWFQIQSMFGFPMCSWLDFQCVHLSWF